MERIFRIGTDVRILCILIILIIRVPVQAQAQDSSQLKISLLTCGPGNDFIGASFGHNGIRIKDSAKGTDDAYNYGTFDFNESNFELRFAQGTLPYCLARSTFQQFIGEYQRAGRSVDEQVLNLTPAQALRLQDLLEENLLPQNRYYIYSSVYDNCATRVRDVVRNAVGDSLRYGASIPGGKRFTFRQVWNAHLTGEVWERFGINILTGTNVDKVMTGEQAMFLPEYLEHGFAGARIGSRPLVRPAVRLMPQRIAMEPDDAIGPPFWSVLAISFLTIICLLVRPLRKAGNILGRVLLFITGLLGVLMVIMWAFTDHKICENNLNLLWALPTNLAAAFMQRNRSRYAIVAIVLLLAVLVIQATGWQVFPLVELWPLLATLLVIHGMAFRHSKAIAAPAS